MCVMSQCCHLLVSPTSISPYSFLFQISENLGSVSQAREVSAPWTGQVTTSSHETSTDPPLQLCVRQHMWCSKESKRSSMSQKSVRCPLAARISITKTKRDPQTHILWCFFYAIQFFFLKYYEYFSVLFTENKNMPKSSLLTKVMLCLEWFGSMLRVI